MTVNRDRPDHASPSPQDPRVRRFDSVCPSFRASVSGFSEHATVRALQCVRDWPTALRFMAIVAVTGIVVAGAACLLISVSPSVRIVVGPVEFEHTEPLLPDAPSCRPPSDFPLANTS